MKQRHAVLDKHGVLGIWQILWGGVFQKVVQNGGLACSTWRNNLTLSQGWGHGHQAQYFMSSSKFICSSI